MFNTYTDEELVNNVDMDMHASLREKTLAMRLAMALDALADLQSDYVELANRVGEEAA